MLTQLQLNALNKVRKLQGRANLRDLQSSQANLRLLADRGLVKVTIALTGAGETMCRAASGKGRE